jgi:hypothetical protein
MDHEQEAMAGVERRERVSGSVNLTSILTGGGLAGRGPDVATGVRLWAVSRPPNWMATRSSVSRRIDRDPCLALDEAGAAQVQERGLKIESEDGGVVLVAANRQW